MSSGNYGSKANVSGSASSVTILVASFGATADTGLTTTAPSPFGAQTSTANLFWMGLS